ncbi:hypothetical protein [Microbacterium sp. SORGH_AS_0862]|uniref:hypothetical protein n=1 Tax=Microbacterium sp. SORGH_AS_0862 TaxID=3041789 RepID=UPI002792C5F8|nr:hypothetical protein [Microbacterium sp. SORGH_AS_0862]MDQ1205067.1 hypothetical protein [Microbacterium sp. SORGH_AS_0862]
MAKSKDQKRAEAAERQARYDAMPTFDKLAVVHSRPGEAKRERDRLLKAAGA